MKKLVCILPSISPDIYFRDMFLVPYYLGVKYDYIVDFVYHGKCGDKIFDYHGVNMIPLFYKGGYDAFSFKSEWYFFWYVLKNAKKIDCLVRFHFSYQTVIICWIYKLINPTGIFYLKADGYGLWLSLFREKSWFKNEKIRNQNNWIIKQKNRIISFLLNSLCRLSDIISVEISEVFDYLSVHSILKKYPQKLKLMHNGIDERFLSTYKIKELDVTEKEKIILSVGRHGSWQKNTGMFLKALSSLNLKDWRVLFIGNIETEDCDFQIEINDFFKKNPYMINKVQFLGPIYDQKELYQYYNKAKVFVHTALYESYGIVLGEAFRFNNFLVSTPVGIAPKLIGFGYGKLCEHNNSTQLCQILQEIIDDKIDLDNLISNRIISNKEFSYDNEIVKLGDLFRKNK